MISLNQEQSKALAFVFLLTKDLISADPKFKPTDYVTYKWKQEPQKAQDSLVLLERKGVLVLNGNRVRLTKYGVNIAKISNGQPYNSPDLSLSLQVISNQPVASDWL